MQKNLFYIAVPILFIIIQGCTTGVSGPGKTTTLGYNLNKLKVKKEKKVNFSLPFHLVVAQAGAIQPDPKVIRELKRYKKLFRKVSILPASPELRKFGKEVDQGDPEALLQMAESFGGDLLLLMGGKVTTHSSKTPLSLLDLTIVGHYIIPSNKINTSGSVIGAVMAVPNRQLVMTIDNDIQLKKITPSVSRHSRSEHLTDKTAERLLIGLAHKFCKQLADNAGIMLDPVSIDEIALEKENKLEEIATIYLISDGFHMGLILPYGQKKGKKQYIEIGLGERNWVMDRNWVWLNATMAGISANEGVAVIEFLDENRLNEKKHQQKKVWKINLSAKQWGNMLSTLEHELALQEVLHNQDNYKVVQTKKGYHLFYTCQQFAMNPLGVKNKNLFNHPTMPTPLVEKHLDQVFKKEKLK